MSYSKNFWILTLGVFLFMTSFNLIIPELNEFITILGGESYKGLIIGLFTLTAAISRPFSGKMADTIGRKSTMYIGTIVCIFITLLYPLSGTVLFFLTLRFFHGFSTGFLPTGATALITDILPVEKRGQGMGVYGTGIALGTGVGQLFASPITKAFTINGLFIASSIIAFISMLLIHSVKETLDERQKFTWKVFKIRKEDIAEVNVIPAAIVMFLTAACSGLVLVLTPDMSGFLNIGNKGYYYGFYVLSTILVRLFAGQLSDKIGRRETLIIGIIILIISMLMTGYSNTKEFYTISSFTYGIASGVLSPAIFAWMADLSPENRRGAGSATIFIALELGILFGAMITLLFYNNNIETIKATFTIGAILAGIALVYVTSHLIMHKRKKLPIN